MRSLYDNHKFKSLCKEFREKATIESGIELSDVLTTVWPSSNDKVNVNNTIVHHKSMLLCLGESQVNKIQISLWDEYIEQIGIKYKTSWMTVLKVAADIYLGKLIGFAKQPRDPQ